MLILCYFPPMVLTKTRAKAAPRKQGFVLGRARFEKICEVEGIKPSAESKRMFEEFDRKGLSNEERRAFIFRKHAKTA